MIKQIHSMNFNEELGSGVAVVDFFATWCGPCKMVAPILDELQDEMKDKVKFFKVDIDKSLDLSNRFNVSSVPTMIIFKNGEEVDKMVGFLPKEKLKENIESKL